MATRQQTPANRPLTPLTGIQTTANMPLTGSLMRAANVQPPSATHQPASVQPVMASQQSTNVQPLMGSQQTHANAQPLMAGQQNAFDVQQHMSSQQNQTHMQPHMSSHQTPANMHQHGDLSPATPGILKQRMGIKQTPVSGLSQTASMQTMQPMTKGDRKRFSASDDNEMLKQIQTTHIPDGREIDVKPLLNIIEDIFKRAVPGVEAIAAAGAMETQALTDANLDDRTYQTSFIHMLETLVYLIDRICCEIVCKCSDGGDTHTMAILILNMLSSYSWDAKLALALSAFAVTYGEFWLVAQSYNSNQLAKAVAILKQLPEILENSSMLKPQFDAIKQLIGAMVNISKVIIEFKELPSHYITAEVEALSTARAHIPVAVYWTIRSILACASQLTGLTLLGREHMVSTIEAWELSSLAHKLTNMHSHLTTQLHICYKLIDEKKHLGTYQNLLHLFETSHKDNMKVLKALIYQKDDLKPLVHGATKLREEKEENLDVLRGKNVLLLISDLDISPEELAILEQIYSEVRQNVPRHDNEYEVVWLPILDPTFTWTETTREQLVKTQSAMPWYTVQHPSLIDPAVVKFVEERWHFQKKPIIVVLNPQGQVVCPNALHMMWIWGAIAFPFTTSREEALWREETWRLELLVDGIDPVVVNWIKEDRYICLYGGEDMEWIRNFTKAATAVAQAENITMGMVYVGKSNPKDRVRRNNNDIAQEKLSHYWQDLTLIWYFWVRLESMWHSKNQLGRNVDDEQIMRESTAALSYDANEGGWPVAEDQITREIKAILCYDASEGGWAVFGKGSEILTRAKGGTFLNCLQEHNLWKEETQRIGFVPALIEHLKKLQTQHHCNRLILPGIPGMMPEKVLCSECGRPMESYIMFRCCND